MKRRLADQSVGPLVSNRPSLALDQALLEAARRVRAGIKVEESFWVIDAHLRPRLLRFFQARFFSRADAEDLVQETLARVYRSVGQLEHEEKLVGWLFAIARNVWRTAVAERQREGRHVAGGIELAEGLPDPRPASWSHDQQLEEQRLEAVRTAIAALPVQQRQCVLLRVRDELSYEEIAETLRLSVHTVRNHLAEAKKNLRRTLKDEFEGDGGL
jgi:RNA polymerase sigma-70 factor (ECF subfamily)